MNAALLNYFDAFEVRLLQSSAVVRYQILRKEVSPSDGKIRVKAALHEGGELEFFEYVVVIRDKIQIMKYSYHWQNADGALKRRWDNAPHYPHLPNAPHHIHEANGEVRENSIASGFFAVIAEIENSLPRSK